MKKYLDVAMGFLILGCMLVVLFGFIFPPIEMPEPPADTPKPPVACTLEAKQCPDGSYVGRIAPDCNFAECPAVATSTDVTPTEPPIDVVSEVTCTPEMRNVDACIELYAPVCGQVQVQCVTTPCNPVPETFSNGCFACMQQNVLSYTEGACSAEIVVTL